MDKIELWTFYFLAFNVLILPEHEAATGRSPGSPCWGCCVSVWSRAGRAGRFPREGKILDRWPAAPSLASDSRAVGCHSPRNSEVRSEVWRDISHLISSYKPACTTECRSHLEDRHFHIQPPRSPGPRRWSSCPPWPSGPTCRSAPAWRRPQPLSSAVSHWRKWEVCCK